MTGVGDTARAGRRFGDDDLRALRRSIHAHAETAFHEIRTAGLVIAAADECRVPVRYGAEAMSWDAVPDAPPQASRREAARAAAGLGVPADLALRLADGGTAVVADMDGTSPGPQWAVRVDMDALPVNESDAATHLPAREDFRSGTGAMHACAHDAHTAIGIGLLHRLSGTAFPGRVRVLFQPAEEGARGAAAMLARGVVTDVDRLVALHLGEDLPAGLVVGGATGLMAARKFRLRFSGAPAHSGLSPERGRNALAAAAHATLGILSLPRYAGARTRVNVGRLVAGDAANIVPGWAEMLAEVRSDDDTSCRDLARRVAEAARAAGQMHGVGVEATVLGSSGTFPPDAGLVAEVLAAAARCGGLSSTMHAAVTASDDASLFAEAVRAHGGAATFMVVGGGNAAPHHSPEFDIDESAMIVALDVLEELIRSNEHI